MPSFLGRSYGRRELLRRVGRLEQLAGVRLVTVGDGAERGGRLLEFRTRTGVQFDVVVDPAFDGRTSNRPARLVGYGERWEGDECVLFAEGEVLQAALFGEQLLLRRRIEARVGESRLQIHDEVENLGHDPTPHMYLYHVNVGFPVVDEGSELLVPAHSVAARGDYPTEGSGVFHGPRAGYVEQVFEHELAAEEDSTVPVAIVNHELGLGAYEVFRFDQLRHHFVWRMLGEGTYVVGIEPSTNRTAGPPRARAPGGVLQAPPRGPPPYQLLVGAAGGA